MPDRMKDEIVAAGTLIHIQGVVFLLAEGTRISGHEHNWKLVTVNKKIGGLTFPPDYKF